MQRLAQGTRPLTVCADDLFHAHFMHLLVAHMLQHTDSTCTFNVMINDMYLHVQWPSLSLNQGVQPLLLMAGHHQPNIT